MTKQIGYQPTDAQRLAGAQRTINALLRRQQLPDAGFGAQYCLWGGGSDTIGATSTHIFDETQFLTNASDVYSLGTRTITGTPYHGISMDKAGLYLVFSVLLLPGLNNSEGEDISIGNADGTPPPTPTSFILGAINRQFYGNTWRADLWAIPDGGLPAAVVFSASNNTASAATSTSAFRLVIRLDIADVTALVF